MPGRAASNCSSPASLTLSPSARLSSRPKEQALRGEGCGFGQVGARIARMLPARPRDVLSSATAALSFIGQP
jgi:hypothetical protein